MSDYMDNKKENSQEPEEIFGKLGQKKALILSAAAEMFSKYGYNKTSLEDIAKEAHIGKGTIYYYFPDKEELFIEVVQVFVDVFFNQLRDMIDRETTFEGKFTVYMQTPIKILSEHSSILSEALNTLSLAHQSKINVFRTENKKRIGRILYDILDFGAAQGIINEDIPTHRFSEIINDWFLMGDENITVMDKTKLINRIQRDHEWIIKILLKGILKRG